jgi:hypothetical protein
MINLLKLPSWGVGKVGVQTLPKLQGAQLHIGDHALNQIAVSAKQSTRFARIMAVISVYVLGVQLQSRPTDGTQTVLSFDQSVKNFWAHASKFHPLVLGATLAKLGISGVAFVLTITVKALLFFSTTFMPHTSVLNAVGPNFWIGVIRRSGLSSFRTGSVFGTRKTPFFSFFRSDWFARSASGFSLFHGANRTMILRELGELNCQ